jgi:predicted dehydrogenase
MARGSGALRLGLVGHGRWGRNIERTLLAFPDVSLAIIPKGEGPRAQLDGVVVATQSANHAEAALPYIEAGVATFIEKPMSTTIAEAERIWQAAKRTGAVVFVGHLFLHHPAFLAALDVLPSLGRVRYILYQGMNDNPRTDSSVLWDWLPHGLSIANAIFASHPDSVSAWNLFGNASPQAALSKFQYGAASLVATNSWLSPIPRMQVTAACENGDLIFDDKAERKLVLYQGRGSASNLSYSEELPLARELSAFLRAIRSGAADPRQIEAGIAVVRAIHAAEQSIVLGGRSVEL